MATTTIGLNDGLAVKKYSAFLAVDFKKKSYFSKKFMSYGKNPKSPIQMLTDLEKADGEYISFDLVNQLRGEGVQGDDVIEGKEESLKTYVDGVYIDQERHGVNAGGRMTRKRTLHDMRAVARDRLGDWWARNIDEQIFMYLSGARGVNNDFLKPPSFTGRASNDIEPPDDDHILYGGDATSKASIDANDKFTLSLIDKAVAKSEMMGGTSLNLSQVEPIMVDGEPHFCVVMSPWQDYDLRKNTNTGEWLDIQKAALAGGNSNKNPIFNGSIGMHNNVVMHKHRNVIRFDDYGSGGNVKTARALFLGRQAGICAYGTPNGKTRYEWVEEKQDGGNQVVIYAGCIYGFKKTRFNDKDFGVICLDTAAADPNK